jgi:hypothetical protein
MRDLTRITDEIAASLEQRAGDILHRMSPEGRRLAQRARERRRKAAMRMARRCIFATFAILLGAMAFGLFVAPLGATGVMAVAILMFLTWAAIIVLSSTPVETPQMLATSDLPLLPQRTEAWLQRQRPALPAPAARLVDGIGLRLEALAPQLQGLDPREPAAVEVRKLIAEELPELIDGYNRVPAGLRKESRNGMMPDTQLIEGLKVVESELGRMTEQLASGDLHKLATQGRYLELKYRGDEAR